MNVILIHNNHRHVSATHVAILREIKKKYTNTIIMCQNHFIVTHYNCICVIVS